MLDLTDKRSSKHEHLQPSQVSHSIGRTHCNGLCRSQRFSVCKLVPAPVTTTSAAARSPRKGLDHPFFAAAKNHPEVIAHRGGAGEWPAETKFACEQAVKVGVDVLELDVHLTKDRHLVLMHNETVDATTNGHGLIRNFTLARLKKLDAGYRWTADGGKTFPVSKKEDHGSDLEGDLRSVSADAYEHRDEVVSSIARENVEPVDP